MLRRFGLRAASTTISAPFSRPARIVAYCKMTVVDRIEPTERERKLFKILTDTLSYAELPTVLRCAGGWVRDKLLGLESDDIDIAVDNMLGKEFADHVNRFLESQDLDTKKVAVIMSNPEQSKHLETARMRLDGLELDLVNLRSETYTDSRIPEMTFGTPKQDAERRDFTINSLFYNLNTNQVEDFTEKGIEDLKAGLIRTPLPASQTFLDDPLRVLRAIRFAARFDFELDDSLQAAAAQPEVQRALARKVSRERIGVELDKMISGPGPVRAMRDLDRLQLLPAVFEMPKNTDAALSSQFGPPGIVLMEAAQQLLTDWQPQGEPLSKDERRLALVSAFLLPLRMLQTALKGSKTQPLAAHLISSCMKWRTSDATCCSIVHSEAPALLECFQHLQGPEAPGSTPLQVKLGRSLRNLKADKWRIGMLMAPLLAMPEAAAVGVEASGSPRPPSSAMQSREARAECCRQLESAIPALGLEACWAWKPLLDGKEIMKLGVKGPAVGKLTAALVDFQLANPKADPEAAKAFLKEQHAKMTAAS